MDFHPGITAWSMSCVLTSPLTVNQSRRFFLVLIWLLKGGGEGGGGIKAEEEQPFQMLLVYEQHLKRQSRAGQYDQQYLS